MCDLAAIEAEENSFWRMSGYGWHCCFIWQDREAVQESGLEAFCHENTRQIISACSWREHECCGPSIRRPDKARQSEDSLAAHAPGQEGRLDIAAQDRKKE